jgi:hypothetical protein
MGATYHLMFRCIVASDTMNPSSRRVVVVRERVARDTNRGASGGTTTARHAEAGFVLVDRDKMPSKIVFARERAVARLVRAHVGLEAVGVVSRHVSLEVERASKRCKNSKFSKTLNNKDWIQTSRAAGALVFLPSIRQGLRLHRNVRLTRDAGNGAELAFTLGRAIAALRAI